MPDMISPVAAEIKVPQPINPLGQLSTIYGIRQQQQNLQIGAANLQEQQAIAQQAQQKNQQLTAAQSLLQKVHSGGYRDSSGNLDAQGLSTDLASIGPYAQEASSNIISLGNEIVKNQAAKQNLTEQSRSDLGNVLTSLASNPNTKRGDVVDGITRYITDHANDPNAIRVASAQLAMLPPDDGTPKFRTVLSNYAGALTGKPQGAPTTVNTGAQTIPGQTLNATGAFTPSAPNAAVQPNGAIQSELSPTLGTNPTTGGPAIIRNNGSVTPVGSSGSQGNGTAGGWQPPADLKNIQSQVESARQAGDQVPVNRDINSRILKLADQTRSGPYTQTAHTLAAAAGLPSGSAYQELGAFLDRQAALASQSMGLPTTNAGLETAKQFTGNTQYDNDVIKDKTKFVDSLQAATAAYRKGMDRTLGTGATPNYAAYQQYRSQWAQNFDPQIFAYENAYKRGDKAEMSKIEQDEGRKGMAELLKKRQTLQGLVNGQ